jgi:hypothetical protein
MIKKFFSREADARSKAIIVVSGLPRSGTSMMMKMLVEGGLQAVTDSQRTADNDNPNGYFEFEPVKKMTEGNIEWLGQAGGKVVKVISALLEHLPAKYHYKVIFMERPLQEVLTSQKKMLANRAEDSSITDVEMEEQFKRHLAAIKYWLARQPNIEVLYMDYGKMLTSPAVYCSRILEFVDSPLDLEKMQEVPNERLYRNRVVTPGK